ncbi:BTB/POZ domain-containing protein [Ditylenchus destructor]|nr:BTB/POZ domain-containing protein [Ditylenchus destructor]
MGNWETRDDYFTARLEDIFPRNETCHAEILFIDEINSISHQFYDKFGLRHRKRIPRYGVEEIIEFRGTENFEHRAAIIRVLEEKKKFVKEFENRWAKDVTFVLNGEKCAGDRQYLSAISPVFKKMLQDHAQDEITLEGVESADELKDLFLAISSFCVQPNPTNVVSLLKLAQEYDIPFLMRSCEVHLKHCYEIPTEDRYLLAMKYNLNGLLEDMIKNLKHEKMMREEIVTRYEQDMKDESDLEDEKKMTTAIEKRTEISLLLKTAEESFIEKKQSIKAEFLKENILKEFKNRWAKDVTFVLNGEKCAGDHHYLSAISPVFKQIMGLRWRKQDKKMLQDHAQDEITLEGVESVDALKDLFLAISSLRVQPNPTNVVSLLKLADYYDIPFLMRNCEEHLKQCSEIPAIDRFLLAMKYNLSGLKLSTEKSLNSDDLVKILGELNDLEQKREVLDRASNNDLAEILKNRKDILNEAGAEFLLQNIAERLGNSYCRRKHAVEVPNVNIFHLLLNYGGQILLRSPQIDLRGQLRNLMCLMQISLNQGLNGQEQQEVAKYLANLMLSLAEQPNPEDVWVIRKFAQMATTSEQVRKWVLDFVRSPRALRELSRLCIRKTLYSENGKSASAAVETLPVPIRQKNYILGCHY